MTKAPENDPELFLYNKNKISYKLVKLVIELVKLRMNLAEKSETTANCVNQPL